MSIPTEIFDRQPPVVQGYLVRAMVSRAAGSPRDISAKHVEAVRALTAGGEEAVLPYGLRAVQGYDRLEVAPEKRLCPGRPEKGLWRHFPLRPGCFLIKRNGNSQKPVYEMV